MIVLLANQKMPLARVRAKLENAMEFRSAAENDEAPAVADDAAGQIKSASKPRRWVAVLFSIFQPGLGHAYCGELLRALLIAAAIALGLQPLLALVGRTATPTALIAVFAAIPIVLIVVAVDAARIAARRRSRLFTRGKILVGCLGFLVVATAVDTGGRWIRDNWILGSYATSSAGMIPTLLVGDRFYIDPRAYERQGPSHGDLVVFRAAWDGNRILPVDLNPDLPTLTIIKRVVGMPGDRISFDGAVLHINGEAKTGAPSSDRIVAPGGELLTLRPEAQGAVRYIIADDPERDAPDDRGPFLVEPNRYFLVGDNRDNSSDSRLWGTIHRNDIYGRPTQVYWSWDYNGSWTGLLSPATWATLLTEKTRWQRIGQPLK